MNSPYNFLPIVMSESAVLGIGLTVRNPPDNKVCLQSSPNGMDKKRRKKTEKEMQFYLAAKRR
jgi:hypothetical protein